MPASRRRRASALAPSQGLLPDRCSCFAVLQDALDEAAGLIRLVADADKPRFRARAAIGPQILGETLLGEIDDAVSGGENGLRRTVVAIERDDIGRRREFSR